MIADARLPDPAKATDRVYGDLRPKTKPPHFAPIVVARQLGRHLYRVQTNRKATRWWYVVTSQGVMLDYAATTSERIADGWIAAIRTAVDPPHECDADCKPFLVDDACTVCGVVRTDACADCGAYSYHRDGCRSSDAGAVR